MTAWGRRIAEALGSVGVGMGVTWRHLFTRKVTLQYPKEKWTLPPRTRMSLFMKYEDCIGCGQCVRACPVDCIGLETRKRPPDAAPLFASNGQPIKLDVTRFDIDLSLCCYCGLCTYPCPTECLYMTSDYETATTELGQLRHSFLKKTEAAS
jgi:NADH-quinone oxidoreductase subunit I